MEELREILRGNLNIEFRSAVLSNPRKKDGAVKVRVRPLLQKEKLIFQLEEFRNNQAFHKNADPREAEGLLLAYMENMRQMQMETARASYTILVSKKGKISVKQREQAQCVKEKEIDRSHNRRKKYVLEEGIPVPFLLDLGVMTKEGKIVNSRFDKFRQINRFLEFIEDILPELDKDRELTILDFGCGKSYLTFAMYYYLKVCRGLDIRITGLDLKEDVICQCSALAKKYGYEKLEFLKGDIAGFQGEEQVDMVVTLHACDTATDYALYKAIGWNTKVILSVPCCQHELNGQLQNEMLAPVLKYGLLKERIAALVTDGLRAELLEQQGYDTQVLEFIDMEHTPKNILIRAVKRTGESRTDCRAYESCTQGLHVRPTLERLLASEHLPSEAYKQRRQNQPGKKGAAG